MILTAEQAQAMSKEIDGENYAVRIRDTRERNSYGVDNDASGVSLFLESKERKSASTLKSYETECRRFMLWLKYERCIALNDVKGADLRDYEEFIKDPRPVWRWIMPQGRRPKDEARSETAIFRGGLSPASTWYAMTVLHGMMSFLSDIGYIKANPFVVYGAPTKKNVDAMGRTYRVERGASGDREISVSSMDEWIATLKRIADRNKSAANERMLWVVSLGCMTGMRRTEMATGVMMDFVEDDECWAIKTIGKGEKLRLIPAPDMLIDALKRYRSFYGLTPLPARSDESPLVRRLSGKGSSSDQTIYLVVKQAAEAAASEMRKNSNERGAEEIDAVSTHWLRHGYASRLVESCKDLSVAKEILDHSDYNTTVRYVKRSMRAKFNAVNEAFKSEK